MATHYNRFRFPVSGFGFRVQGSEFRVQSSGFPKSGEPGTGNGEPCTLNPKLRLTGHHFRMTIVKKCFCRMREDLAREDDMDRWTGKYSESLYGIMRIVSGLLFACHGAQKLFGAFGGAGITHLPPLLIAAGIIEFVCGILVAIGFRAGYAAFLASGQMAVAYFMMHAPGGFWPIANKGELAVVYCFIFLYIASKGSGILSIDKAVGSRQ